MSREDYIKKIEELGNLEPRFSEKNGKPYIEWEQYRDAMDDAFGVNYEAVMVGEPQFTFLPKDNGSVTPMATVSVELVVHDDNGNVLAKRRAPGSVVYEKVKDTGEYAWPQNVTFNAYTAAFRNCCKLLGVFENAKRPNSGKGNGKGKRNVVSPAGSNSSSKVMSNSTGAKTFHVVTSGNVTITGGNDGRQKVYKLRCIDNNDKAEKELVIYDNKIDAASISNIIEKINIGAGVPYKLSFEAYQVKKAEFEYPQLIFQRFV